MDRIAAIRERLTRILRPEKLDIMDESHLHIGHRGHRGAGHFRIYIVSDQFRDKTIVARHQMVYAALNDLMPNEIHALGIQTSSHEEHTHRI